MVLNVEETPVVIVMYLAGRRGRLKEKFVNVEVSGDCGPEVVEGTWKNMFVFSQKNCTAVGAAAVGIFPMRLIVIFVYGIKANAAIAALENSRNEICLGIKYYVIMI